MRRRIRALAVGAIGGAMLLAVSASAAAGANTTSCTGELAPGSYGKVVVPEGALCLSEGPVTIHGGVVVGSGATFGLGSDEQPRDTGTITGGVRAVNPSGVQIHHTRIDGGLDIQGGSGPFGGPFGVTWNAIEDNRINGSVSIQGYNGFWFGFLGNHVNGSVRLNNNVLEDPDGNEYPSNVIHGSLQCSGNSPEAQFGDAGGVENQVTGQKTGQCAKLK
jgi:hypothetical protein